MPGRKHPIHLIPFAGGDRAIIVFVTVVTQGRQRCLANEAAHTLLRATWSAAGFWRVGRYVIMPDHVHYFCAPTASDCSLEKWMQFWKSQLTKAWLGADEKPVRAGLVTHPDAWPYQGELNDLRW